MSPITEPFAKELTEFNSVSLFYGGSGMQKTRLAAQYPSPLFLSCDPGPYGGLLSAREFKPKQILVRSYEDYMNGLGEVRERAGKDIKTIVLDSITYFTQHVVKSALNTPGRQIKRASENEVPRLDDWGLVQARLRTVINTLASLPCNLVIIALEQIIKDEVTGKITGRPNIPGKLAEELPAGVDICLHFTARASYDSLGKKSTRFLVTSTPDDMWTAKDRFGILPAEFELSIEPFNSILTRKGV